jgi:adenosine deaminase
MQVGIEVNPSSNLLVGGFRAIFEQPVFHFDDLPILISADDPLTFATTLADDYAYAWAGMILPGHITPKDATQRLVDAARNSERYHFGGPTLDPPKEQGDLSRAGARR